MTEAMAYISIAIAIVNVSLMACIATKFFELKRRGKL